MVTYRPPLPHLYRRNPNRGTATAERNLFALGSTGRRRLLYDGGEPRNNIDGKFINQK
jgi:hypothetical protein